MNIPAVQRELIENAAPFEPAFIEALRELQPEGEDSLVSDIARQFIHDTELRLAQIVSAITARDFAELSSIAHNVKGSAGTFGLAQAAAISRELEIAADALDSEAAEFWREWLSRSFEAGKSQLETHL